MCAPSAVREVEGGACQVAVPRELPVRVCFCMGGVTGNVLTSAGSEIAGTNLGEQLTSQ